MTKVDETRSDRGASERASSADERTERGGEGGNFDEILRRKRRRADDRATETRHRRTARNDRRADRGETSRQRRDRRERTDSERRRSTDRQTKDQKYRRRERKAHTRRRRTDRRHRETSSGDGIEAGSSRSGNDDAATPDTGAGPSRPATHDIGVRPSRSGADDEIVARPSRSGASTDAAEPTAAKRADDIERIRELARQIVDAVRIGTDQSRRQVLVVDARVPGRGDVHIRLRRDGQGFEARMRADSEKLARTLRRSEETLRETARERDVLFSSIEVVT